MFSSTTQEHLTASALAGDHLKAWEKTLAFRVSLQKPLDLANQLPVALNQNDASLKSLSDQLRSQMNSLSDLLEQQIVHSDKTTATLRKKNSSADDDEEIWEQLYKQQSELQTTRWEPVLNKWHARLNFGSEKTKAKLKVFTQSMWDQVEDTLTDEHRSVSKSRMPWEESRRLDKRSADEDGSEEAKHEWSAPLSAQSGKKGAKEGNKRSVQEVYDHEVYDDRMFYAMLLKTFITSASSNSSGGGGAGSGDGAGGVMGTMRAGDLEALRQYKRKKLNVERKASKGRKVRYNVHDKLQNFMFPVGGSLALTENISIDAEKLFQSLFQ